MAWDWLPDPLEKGVEKVVSDVERGWNLAIGAIAQASHGKPQAYRNPPFSKELLNLPNQGIPGRHKQGLARGLIKTDESAHGAEGYRGTKDVYRLYFLYNPSVVSASHNVDMEVPGEPPPDDVGFGEGILGMSQQVSFTLLFDRTFELYYQEYVDKKVPHRGGATYSELGVLMDVLLFYDMMGMTLQRDFSDKAAGEVLSVADRSQKKSNTAVGPMLYTPVRVYFGRYLRYFGTINSAQIQYTHWSQRMVPMRCTLDIGMTLLPDTRPENARSVSSKAAWFKAGAEFERPNWKYKA